jgi:hypothetical protein
MQLKTILRQVPDPRGKQAQDYRLWSILGLIVVSLCGRRGMKAAFLPGRGKDKQVATDPRRFTVVEPPPFAPQFLEAERPNAIDLARDRSGIHRSHG